MPAITEDQCKEARIQCARTQAAVFGRLEDKLDGVSDQLTALASLYGRISALENWRAMLNGRAAALAENPQSHHRSADEIERTHQRAADVVAEAAVIAADKVAMAATEAIAKVSAAREVAESTSDHDPPIKLTWKTAAVVAAFLVAIIYAIASDRAREVLPKPPGVVTSPQVPK